MKVVALVSGGKDSSYAMMKCQQYGHQIVALANLMPVDDAQDELDSYMNLGLNYNVTPGDEVEDMLILLKEVKRKIPSVSAVSSGAIASDYQRLRVESIKSDIIAITVKVAAIGLVPSKHLGKELTQLESHLHKLKELYGINNARVVLDKFEVVLHSPDQIAPVGVLHPLEYHLEKKLVSLSNEKSNEVTVEEIGSATLHKDVLYMAGQLGLNPPTMLLRDEGPLLEFQQALVNAEAVAKSFNCSISTSAVALIIYCSVSLNSFDRAAIENQKDVCLAEMKLGLISGSRSKVPAVNGPIILYILVPDLPKSASVEVKPLLYSGENSEIPTKQAVVSVTHEIATKICSEAIDNEAKSDVNTEKHVLRMAKFCIYLLDNVLLENDFSWDDIMNLRIYFTANTHTSHETLSTIFANVFNEFGEMSKRIDSKDKGPIYNLVPVLGAGRSATSVDDNIFTWQVYLANVCLQFAHYSLYKCS
ncbi:diphthine--ammonia ligase [Phtheirospermum japonicum]|uniref:Diphthine--ammonia ligase n=1 Tax=Phtheirospermum japonicum TaxID=374723 RepID=A0A830BFC5_9LAMI|nr:diphthine--ammonia ligase [Phtheirospermum japonicum]